MDKYDIIYCDVPWEYKDKASAGKRGACHKYPVLNTARVKALPVHLMAKKDCALFMWATMPLLPDALEVMAAWGFEYKTVAFVWVKSTSKAIAYGFNLAWGMGNWSRACCEIVLLGVRGKPKRVSASVHQVVICPTLRPHSRKPYEVRDRIVELMEPPDAPLDKIELFATQTVPDWKCTGLSSDGLDIRDLLEDYNAEI